MGTKSETETVGRWTREVSTQLYQVENLTRRNPSVHQHGPSLPGIELMAYAKLSIWTWAIAWGLFAGEGLDIVSPSFHPIRYHSTYPTARLLALRRGLPLPGTFAGGPKCVSENNKRDLFTRGE
jgi:hypothetical protein